MSEKLKRIVAAARDTVIGMHARAFPRVFSRIGRVIVLWAKLAWTPSFQVPPIAAHGGKLKMIEKKKKETIDRKIKIFFPCMLPRYLVEWHRIRICTVFYDKHRKF